MKEGPFGCRVTAFADQDISSSTTLTDDDELKFEIAAGALYEFWLSLVYSSPSGGTTPDLKWTFTGPATLTGLQWLGEASYNLSDAAANPSDQGLTTTNTAGTATTPRVLCVHGWVHSTGSGLFKLQWAQNTSNSNATRRHAGSRFLFDALIEP